jgi:hypothetical protein
MTTKIESALGGPTALLARDFDDVVIAHVFSVPISRGFSAAI